VLHVQGKHGGAEPVASGVPYVVLDYVDRMDLALAAADLAVCRAGANTVVETAATGLPAVFVPLPIGNGEQQHNARPVVAAGGGLLVRDDDLTPDWVADHITALLVDTVRLARMSAAAQALVPRDADDRLARIITEAAR
jgi:UDP-N-acetylglucosamine--N-acetylmuramyl-(pentapeptide) pyrophosphoryl-undecaprenol N-acetylglucosamine transferase